MPGNLSKPTHECNFTTELTQGAAARPNQNTRDDGNQAAGLVRRLAIGSSAGAGLQPELAGDEHPLDLASALADLEDLRVAVEAPDRALVHAAGAAEDLDGRAALSVAAFDDTSLAMAASP